MITLTHTQWGETSTLQPEFGRYANDRLAIKMIDLDWAEPFATITVNLGPDDRLDNGEVHIKDWAENEEIVAHLVDEGWLIPTGVEVPVGHVSAKVMMLGGDLLEAYEEQA